MREKTTHLFHNVVFEGAPQMFLPRSRHSNIRHSPLIENLMVYHHTSVKPSCLGKKKTTQEIYFTQFILGKILPLYMVQFVLQ